MKAVSLKKGKMVSNWLPKGKKEANYKVSFVK